MRVDTRGNLCPEVKDAVFEVMNVPEQGSWPNGGTYWKFELGTVIKDQKVKHNENLTSDYLGPMLRALDFPEMPDEPGVYDFEPALALGRFIVASIRHEVQKKGKNAGKTYARMYDARKSEEVAF